MSQFNQTATAISRRQFLGTLCATTLTAPSALATPRGNTMLIPRNVLFIGASITSGHGLRNAQAYPAVFARLAGEEGVSVHVSNLARAGMSSTAFCHALPNVLHGVAAPSLIVSSIGIGDPFMGVLPATSADNVEAMVQQLRRRWPDAAIALWHNTMFQPGLRDRIPRETRVRYDALWPRLCHITQTHLIQRPLAGVAGVSTMNQPDLIHPNAAGAERIAQNVWSAVCHLTSPTTL